MSKMAILAVLGLVAGAVLAGDVVVFDGAMQNGWTAGDWSIVQAPGQPVGVNALNAVVDGSLNLDGRQDIAGNTYLEADVYCDTTGGYTGHQFAHIVESYSIDHPMYEMAGVGSSPTYWIDGVEPPTTYTFDFAENTWQHYKLDLTTPTKGYFPTPDGKFGLRFYEWNGRPIPDMYLMNVRFTLGVAAIPGDTDGDSDVDLDDLFAVRNNFGTTSGASLGDGDTDDDGDVDLDDLFAVRNNFGTGLIVIPEPVTLSLLGMGLVALLRRR